MLKLITIFSMSLLAGCVATKVVMAPQQSDVDRMATKYPGYTLTQLNEGKTNYELYCQACHDLKKPSNWKEQEWVEIVPDMVKKSNRKKKTSINDKTQDLILKYLVTMGKN